MARLAISAGANGLLLGVRVSPSAPRTTVRGVYGDRLKISLNAPPEDNRANDLLVESLAAWLGLRKDDVRIASGHGSRDKVVAFAGLDEAELRMRLSGLMRGTSRRKGDE